VRAGVGVVELGVLILVLGGAEILGVWFWERSCIKVRARLGAFIS
jgi:hypothetical protein